MKSKFFFVSVTLIIFLITSTFFLFSNSNVAQQIKSYVPLEIKIFLKKNLFYFPNLVKENQELENNNNELYIRISKLENLTNFENEKFFPKTQFLDLNYQEIPLDLKGDIIFERYGSYAVPFYIDVYKNDLIITNKEGNFFYEKIDNLLSANFNLRQVETNLPSGEILDILVFENQLFVSQATKDEKGCHTNNISIYSAIVSLRYLDFSEFYANPLNNDKNKVDKYCDNKMSPVGGALEIDTINNTILITGTIFDNKFEKFKSNEIDGNFLKTNKFASIFSIDLITKEKKIISIGHRNPLGLIKNKEGYILSTEHGPRGGDEINKIIENKNYGWPIVSAGEPYVTKANDIYFYKKNHEKNGFEEPIYSFVPSIGISRIIEINDNFSSKWQNNYFITSLRNKSLYRVEFDNKFTKVKTIEKINVGKRIRDISYSSTKKLFFLALESKQANLGILYKK